jgi:hypothetical protein
LKKIQYTKRNSSCCNIRLARKARIEKNSIRQERRLIRKNLIRETQRRRHRHIRAAMTSNNNSNSIISKTMANDSSSGSSSSSRSNISSLSDIIPFDYTLKGRRVKLIHTNNPITCNNKDIWYCINSSF